MTHPDQTVRVPTKVLVLKSAVERLILAADMYGVSHLDSDDMDDDATELQDATESMKDELAASPSPEAEGAGDFTGDKGRKLAVRIASGVVNPTSSPIYDKAMRALAIGPEAPVSEAVAIGWASEWTGMEGKLCLGFHHDKHEAHDAAKWMHGRSFPVFDHPAPSPASAWKPIETAPKDGTPIDIWVTGPGARRVPHCRWGTPSRANWGDRYGDDKNLPVQWVTVAGFALDRRNGIATHWMPLPTPPSTEGSGE